MLGKFVLPVLIFGAVCFLVNGQRTCDAADEAASDQINLTPVTPKVTVGSRFLGDINADGVMNPADMVYILSWLFKDGPAPPVMDDADLNEDGTVDIADVIVLSKWLWYYTW